MTKGQLSGGVLVLLLGALAWFVLLRPAFFANEQLPGRPDLLVPLASYHKRGASLGLCVQSTTTAGAYLVECPPAFAGLYVAPPTPSQPSHHLIRHQVSKMSIRGEATLRPIATESATDVWNAEFAIYDEDQGIKQPTQVRQNVTAMGIECMSRQIDGSMVIGESIGCVRYRHISDAEASGSVLRHWITAKFGESGDSVLEYGSPRHFTITSPSQAPEEPAKPK